MSWLFFAAVGYLSGSVLYAYYLPLWLKGVDICRDAPDGNPGVYNCVRGAGWAVGLTALGCELLKGALPVLWAARTLGADGWGMGLVMAAPVAGHAFPLFRRFRGGKGIAASFGVLLGLAPMWQPVALLAGCYLFFSSVVQVDPHRARSVVTFLCFGIGGTVWFWGSPVALGCALILGVVLPRHLRHLPQEEPARVRVLPALRGQRDAM